MTPQQAYEKHNAHTWESAPPHSRDLWLAAWMIAGAIAEEIEREVCAQVREARYMGDNNREDMEARRCAAAIRARSQA